jgi:hypothetical protein
MSFADLLKPRPEVLSDEGIDGIIDVANVYIKGKKKRLPLEARPRDFFALTYPTADVRRVVEQLHRRFSEDSNVSGLFLFEGLKGSGKSHLLLLVHHLFANRDAATEWLNQHGLTCSLPGDIEVILIKFTDLPLESIWDFIFERLTGKRPETRVVQPSLEQVTEALGGRRLLLIFDELEQGIQVIGDPAIRAQNIAFLQMLSEWSLRSNQVTLCASIYSDQEEPGSTLKRVPSTRVHFSQASDRAHVVSHRLFSNYLEFDPRDAVPVVDSYLSLWQRYIPSMDAESMRTSTLQFFPFSPDLMKILLEQIPERGGFQNVRGTLGFLEQLVRVNYQSADLLTPAHARLNDRVVCNYLGDLGVGGEVIRRARGNLEELVPTVPLAVDVASTTMIYTLTGKGRTVGVTRDEMVRCVMRPGVDINEVEQTLMTFQKYASHFHFQEGRYLFDIEENPDAKVEFRSLSVNNNDAREKIRGVWFSDIFREPNAVVFTDVESTKEACEALDKSRLRYVLAPRRLRSEERVDLYHGMTARNQIILLEPRDNAFDASTNVDLLKWAKRYIAAQDLSNTPDASRRAQYERISKEDKNNIITALKRAGLLYIRFEPDNSSSGEYLLEAESLGNAVSKEDVLNALNQKVYPLQFMQEHLSGRVKELKGRSVEEIDREYRTVLGFPVPTHAGAVSKALREMCRQAPPKISLRHPRADALSLSEAEMMTAVIDDPMPASESAPRGVARPIQQDFTDTTPATFDDDRPEPIPAHTPTRQPSARRETVAILTQPSAGALRQEIAAKLQNYAAAKVVRASFTVYLNQSTGDLSTLPASIRGGLSGQGNLSVEISLTKEGEFTKGEIEQIAESLPAITSAEYSARLEVSAEQWEQAEVHHG